MIKVNFTTEVNMNTGTNDKTCQLIMNAEMFRNAISAKVDVELYLNIASFMTEEGKCYVTEERLAKQMGVTRPTISKRIKKLLDVEIDGKPILCKELIPHGWYNSTEFTVNAPINVADAEIKKPKATSKQVLDYFCTKYKEKYEVSYTVSGGRDSNLIKTKLLNVYDIDLIYKGIDYLFENYDNSTWKSSQYPRPSIFTITGWVWNKIIEQMAEQEKITAKQEADFAIDVDELNRRMEDLI